MNIRQKLQVVVAVALLAVFGITATGADLTPQDDIPELGITATGLDFLPQDEVPTLGITFNFVD